MNLTPDDHTFEEVAIIGMSCRFPQSPTPEAFWKNLKEGRELISFFSDDELAETREDILNNPHYVKAKAYLESAKFFDADLFGYSPKEAQTMDPQHRVLLECAWEALENAGYNSEHYSGNIGVFVGCNPNSYFLTHLYPGIEKGSQSEHEELGLLLGNSNDYLATRLSYKLNLKGPSKTIQTACSTSLVAVHDACQSLLNFQTDIALAGGVSLSFPHKNGYFYSPEGINSPDGHCRAFDQKAAGTVFGDGVGLVVLKRYEDALRDHDTILAVIKGSAVNNDGSEKISFFAPSVEGQARVIISALASAGVLPETISYLETHGTGTALGDPIEIAALKKAFQLYTDKQQFCALGAVKANVGHLITAAGIASLIKTILMLNHQEIPPLLHFETPNPQMEFSKSPFYVNTKLETWKEGNCPRRAGISSFGMGGTNAHVILEEAPSHPFNHSSKEDEFFFLPFSANDPNALFQLLNKFITYFDGTPAPVAHIAHTLQVGRKSLPFRAFFIVQNHLEAKKQLEAYLISNSPPSKAHQKPSTEKIDYSTLGVPTFSSLQYLGSLWQLGTKIDWAKVYPKRVFPRVPLPSYPFARVIYFPDVHPNPTTQQKIKSRSLTQIEKLLSIFWEENLQLEYIAPEDNFFALGGDSLKALEIAEQLREAFCLEFSLDHFFTHQTIHEMAQLLDQLKKERQKKIQFNSPTIYG